MIQSISILKIVITDDDLEIIMLLGLHFQDW